MASIRATSPLPNSSTGNLAFHGTVFFKFEVMSHYWVTAVVLSVLVMFLEGIWVFTKDKDTVYFEANGQSIVAGKFSEPPRPGGNCPHLT